MFLKKMTPEYVCPDCPGAVPLKPDGLEFSDQILEKIKKEEACKHDWPISGRYSGHMRSVQCRLCGKFNSHYPRKPSCKVYWCPKCFNRFKSEPLEPEE
jgi:hypothetical protein